MNGSHNGRRRKPSRGALLVCVLVCMLVAIALVNASVQHSLRARREVRFQQQMLQTEYLLDAGIRRAVEQLSRSADYQGESWRPEAAITRFRPAAVDIRVTGDRVEVTASLGVAVEDAQRLQASRTKRSHSFTFHPPNPTPESSHAE